jgi:hypothetical protein
VFWKKIKNNAWRPEESGGTIAKKKKEKNGYIIITSERSFDMHELWVLVSTI